MIDFFVKHPITTIMFVLVFVVLGVVAAGNIPIERDPKIEFPIVTVSVEYPGATPLEIETLVVNKIEDAVAELSQINKMRSDSLENVGVVSIEFILGTDVNTKFIEVKDKVEAILNELPLDIKKPIIEKFDPLVEPILDLVLLSDTVDGRALYEFADKTLKNQLSAIDGVANVDIYGGRERQVNVELDPLLMKQRFVTATDVVNALRQRNRNIPGGVLEKDARSLSVRFTGEFESVADIAATLIVSRDGSQFPLSDIARVEDSFKRIESIARFNGRYAVNLSVNKVSDGNAVKIRQAFDRRLPLILKSLPAGVTLEVAADNTTFILNETRDTEWSIVIGILLTVIVLYLFTGRIRPTIIAAVVIPTSLISAMFLMGASQFTINFVTLMAIANALGTLIANAIIIIDSVNVHLGRGKSSEQAAIDGTKEVGVAVFASTGTNLVVFAPLAFMGGIVGQFMRSFGLTVIYATLFSLLASFALTPMMCALMLRPEKPRGANAQPPAPWQLLVQWPVKATHAVIMFLIKEYRILFDLMFRFPKTTVALSVLTVLGLRFIMPYIGSDFFSRSDEDKIFINLVMPQGATIERTLSAAEVLERRVAQIPEMVSYLTRIGENGSQNATLTVNLTPSPQRRRSDIDIINELIPFVARIPDAEIDLLRAGGHGDSAGDVSVNVTGDDYQNMIALSLQMKERMERSGYFRSVRSSYKTPKDELRFVPDQARLVSFGLTNAAVGGIIRDAIYGDKSNIYKEAGEDYDINVELRQEYSQDRDDVQAIDIIGRGGLVPVTSLGTVVSDKAIPGIKHRDRSRIIRMEGFLSKSTLGDVKKVLDKEFSQLDFPAGSGYSYVGDSEYQEESARETSRAFMLAVILTYMLLAAIMNSTIDPLPIMTTVLTSFVGVFLMLFFLDQSINVATMLGMVMLVGIVVNNAILMLDYAMQKMREGVPTIEALWLGASEKFRAIIMTSIAIIMGVAPQLGAIMKVKVSMAAVMVGGILGSIVFTFLFVPVSFMYIEKLRNIGKRKRANAASA